jgi:uncharacterized protein (TIGR02594 family)
MAESQIGVAEVPGNQANPKILGYIATFPGLAGIEADGQPGLTMERTDETAWCACFTNWVLIRAGQRRGPSARAADWQGYGQACGPIEGALAVIRNPKPSSTTASGFHVAFLRRQTSTGVLLLGGNQGNMVKDEEFTRARGWNLLATRWPN